MSGRARHGTSLLALAAVAVIAILFAGGLSSGAHTAPPCGASTDATYRDATLSLARRLAAGELHGNAVHRALRTIQSDRVLAAAVAAGDDAAARKEMLVILYNHEHIVRLRVLRAGRLVADVGGPLVLSPVRGVLRAGGRVVGSFVMSLQDDMGFRLLLSRLAGAHSVMVHRGRVAMRDIPVAAAALRDGGTVRSSGVRYLVAELDVGRFPRGTLHVFVLVRAPPAALARRSCDQVRVDALAAIARHGYQESLSGPLISKALAAIAGAASLRSALAAGDAAAAESVVRSLVAKGGFAALRVFARGHLVAEAGAPGPLVAPVTRTLRAPGGLVYGRAVFTAQSARSYVALAHYLTGAQVLVRNGRDRLAGTFAGPATLPRSGRVEVSGTGYRVASFPAQRYPRGAIVVYVLIPERP